MSRENWAGRDQRPPAARFAEIEAALDKRVLDVLSKAHALAAERGLVAGGYWQLEDVHECARENAEVTLTDEQARKALAVFARYEIQDGDTLLDAIWDVIA